MTSKGHREPSGRTTVVHLASERRRYPLLRNCCGVNSCASLAPRAAQESFEKTVACHPYYNLIEKILQCQGARVRSASRDASVFIYSSMETTRG